MSSSRPARVGFLAFLAALIALVGGYLGNCFSGLGLSPGSGPGEAVKDVKDAAKDVARDVSKIDATAKAHVIVQGEHCRRDGETATLACTDLCKSIGAGDVVIEATVGAQQTVETLKTCLQARGVKVQIVTK